MEKRLKLYHSALLCEQTVFVNSKDVSRTAWKTVGPAAICPPSYANDETRTLSAVCWKARWKITGIYQWKSKRSQPFGESAGP